MRQIAGVFARLEKARLVSKLKAARDRQRATGKKVEGRKSYAEIDARDHAGQMIALAKKLRRKTPKGGRRSLRAISAELARAGFVSQSGKPYAATAVGRMLARSTRPSQRSPGRRSAEQETVQTFPAGRGLFMRFERKAVFRGANHRP
jgi:hypothetical protein